MNIITFFYGFKKCSIIKFKLNLERYIKVFIIQHFLIILIYFTIGGYYDYLTDNVVFLKIILQRFFFIKFKIL